MFGVTDRLTNQDIYERIYAAISERKLQPGTKLSEERLATVFHVSRTRIREVLFRLSQELIVDLHPNRGAFIASPTQADMQDVFQVRQALERGVVVHLCQTCPHPSVPSLQAHLLLEAQARSGGDSAALAGLRDELQLTLTALGYEPLEINRALRAVAQLGQAGAGDGEAWLRESLRWLSRGEAA